MRPYWVNLTHQGIRKIATEVFDILNPSTGNVYF